MVRKANEKDIDFIINLAKKSPELNASKNEILPSKNELLEWLNDNKVIFLVEEDKGFLLAKLNSSEWCMIDALSIAPNFRNQGIATKLLDQLYLILKEKDINYISGLVLENSDLSRTFWKKKDFVEGKNLVWFEKDLK
jgi:ribosomal protein S18 acetylase RimI-like enzyme